MDLLKGQRAEQRIANGGVLVAVETDDAKAAAVLASLTEFGGHDVIADAA